ncbi:MarR family transcriptional regulator [bacterium]|nr:MarR family transcriptional regulator [bacterium]
MSSGEGEASSDLAQELVKLMPAFDRAMSRWVQSLIESGGGSSHARIKLLGVLHCKGPQIMCNLSDELGVTARQVTNLVDALEGERLVRRLPHPSDRRATLVEATEEGFKLAEQLWEPLHRELASLYRELPITDQQVLARIMGDLLATLKKRTGGEGESRDCS